VHRPSSVGPAVRGGACSLFFCCARHGGPCLCVRGRDAPIVAVIQSRGHVSTFARQCHFQASEGPPARRAAAHVFQSSKSVRRPSSVRIRSTGSLSCACPMHLTVFCTSGTGGHPLHPRRCRCLHVGLSGPVQCQAVIVYTLFYLFLGCPPSDGCFLAPATHMTRAQAAGSTIHGRIVALPSLPSSSSAFPLGSPPFPPAGLQRRVSPAGEKKYLSASGFAVVRRFVNGATAAVLLTV